MEIKAYAKVNLALKIVGVDPIDGYHKLEMVNVPISLCDDIFIEIDNSLIDHRITCNIKEVPLDSRNLVYKAIILLKEKYGFEEKFNIHIEKKIPIGGGLAGGSSNAASVIIGINKMLNLEKELEKLDDVAFKVGADVPYCLHMAPSIVKGKGEELEKFNIDENYYLLLIKGKKGLSTKDVYKKFDEKKISSLSIDCEKLKKALIDGDEELINRYMGNDLEIPAFEFNKEVQLIKERLIEFGLKNTMMTGSGACVFSLSKEKEILEKAKTLFDENDYFIAIASII